jgi:hypothetical protein
MNINVYTDRIRSCEINYAGTGYGQWWDLINASMNLVFHRSGQHPGHMKILSKTEVRSD